MNANARTASNRSPAGTVLPNGLLIVVGLLLVPLAGGCHRAANKTTEAMEEAVTEVKIVHPRPTTITRDIKQPGYLRAYEQTPIYTKIPGFIQEVNVDRGDAVKKGALLAKLWVPEMESELRAREARVRQAEADLKQAEAAIEAAQATVASSAAGINVAEKALVRSKAERERWDKEVVRDTTAFKKGLFDQQTLDEARNQFQSSEAAVGEATARVVAANAFYAENLAKFRKSQADRDAVEARVQVTRADLRQQHDWLGYADLRAPYDGVVTARNVHTGAFLQPTSSGSNTKSADPLFMLMRTDILRVTVQVPERDAVLIKQAAAGPPNGKSSSGAGSPAVVRLQALPGREFLGNVTRDSWSFDEAARTLIVEIHLKNTAGELHVNMYADVVITVELSNVLALPSAAMLTDGNENYCMQLQDGKAVRMVLQLGVRTEQWTQVLAKREASATGELGPWTPLTGNEAVIISNPAALINNQPVRVSD